MKIISIVTSFPRKENDVLIPWIIRLVKELRAYNIETDVFTSSYCGLHDESRDGTKVRRFRYFFKRWENLSHDMSVPEKLKKDKRYFLVLPFFMLFGMIAGYRYGRKNDFDVIHVHFPFPLALFGIAMKFASKKPMIVSCHGSEVNMAKKNRVFRAIFRWMMKRADGITVNSTFMQKEVTKIVTNCDNIEIIPMGSGIGDVEIKENKEKTKEKTKILYVGRLIKWKGVDYLIHAFKMLDPSKYELHIVGDGPEMDSLKDSDQRSRGSNKLPVESGKAAWKTTKGRVERNSTGEHQSSPRLRLAGMGSPLHAVVDCTTPSTGEQSSPASTQSQTALHLSTGEQSSPASTQSQTALHLSTGEQGSTTSTQSQTALHLSTGEQGSTTSTQSQTALHLSTGEQSSPTSTQSQTAILFHGYLTGTDLQNMYGDADIFVLPSIVDDGGYTEGLGVVLLEAMSHGIPVIGTNVGGIPDIVIDGVTGILVPQKDPQAIADAIETLTKNDNLRQTLTKNGKDHLTTNFSWKMITSKFVKIYVERQSRV